jgi:hypothetical protein
MEAKTVRNSYRIAMGKPEETATKNKHTGVDNITLDFGEDGVVWTGLIWLKIETARRLL